MGFIEWEDRYDVKVGAMNDEHRELMRLMNRLHELEVAKAPRAELGRALEELGSFTVEHFKHEEEYQASIGYPGLASHQKIHADLLAKFGAHKQDFDEGSGGLGEKFFHFLKFWLSAHIAGVDRKYGDHSSSAKRLAS